MNRHWMIILAAGVLFACPTVGKCCGKTKKDGEKASSTAIKKVVKPDSVDKPSPATQPKTRPAGPSRLWVPKMTPDWRSPGRPRTTIKATSATSPLQVNVDASAVIFVVDRSASMVSHWEWMRGDFQRAVRELPAGKKFHVVTFGPKIAKPTSAKPTSVKGKAAPRTLGPARNVKTIAKQCPFCALTAAMKLCEGTEAKTVVIFLSDGLFPNPKAVLELLAKRKPEKRPRIFTFLYGPADPAGISTMKQIAKENGGRFKCVTK